MIMKAVTVSIRASFVGAFRTKLESGADLRNIFMTNNKIIINNTNK